MLAIALLKTPFWTKIGKRIQNIFGGLEVSVFAPCTFYRDTILKCCIIFDIAVEHGITNSPETEQQLAE